MAPLPQGASGSGHPSLLECVVNVSEGRDAALVKRLAATTGNCLLDLHADADHNRSVLTLAGAAGDVQSAVRELTTAAVATLDLRAHTGAHPRFGVVDVVPWVALEACPARDAVDPTPARQARDDFAAWAARRLELPVFLYGPERSLPQVRQEAWRSLRPDLGPPEPHPTAGSVAVGQRPLMLAYNLWVRDLELVEAQAVAAALRSPQVRALAFMLGGRLQLSFNLLQPLEVGPEKVYDQVSALAPVERAELVGLAPAAVLEGIPAERWPALGLSPGSTIEARAPAGLLTCRHC